MAFGSWSTTAGSNTTIGGISIAEGCPPSNLNNAQREMMAELRVAFNPALDTFHATASLAAARTALGAVGSAGDTVTGNLVRSSAGPHLYHTTAAFGSGKVFFTAVGASDPTSAPGDIWITGS
jgi:hypothetical protein